MSRTIPVAHDFSCPWCWIGLFQARRLQAEFGITIDWLAYELFPEELDWPEPRDPAPEVPNKPKTPSRLALAYAASGVTPPPYKGHPMRTWFAHEAVQFAKTVGVADQVVEALYRAYWENGRDLEDPEVVLEVAGAWVEDAEALRDSVLSRRHRDQIVGFDDPAYASGVFNLPTFFIGGERFAEQPFGVLHQAMTAWLGSESGVAPAYPHLSFPEPPADRPYTVINMVATIDGKTVSVDRDSTVMDLGSKVDHATLRQIELAGDAVMLGAQTLRATPKLWYDPRLVRVVVTQSGRMSFENRFFTDVPEKAIVAGPETLQVEAIPGVEVFGKGLPGTDFSTLLRKLRQERGVRILVVEGGSELNASLLELDLVDEMFLTVAPKVKLGREIPTYAGGTPLPPGELLNFTLVEYHVVKDEIFLRYRRHR